MIIFILKFLELTALAVGFTFIICFSFWLSFEFLKGVVFSFQAIKTSFHAIKKFERFAELYYKAVKLVPDKEAQDRLKTQWEDELCQK